MRPIRAQDLDACLYPVLLKIYELTPYIPQNIALSSRDYYYLCDDLFRLKAAPIPPIKLNTLFGSFTIVEDPTMKTGQIVLRYDEVRERMAVGYARIIKEIPVTDDWSAPVTFGIPGSPQNLGDDGATASPADRS